jgi:hypothetical protein
MTGCGNRNDAVNGIAPYGCGERTDTLTVECRAANFGPESNRCRIRARQGNRHRYFFRLEMGKSEAELSIIWLLRLWNLILDN